VIVLTEQPGYFKKEPRKVYKSNILTLSGAAELLYSGTVELSLACRDIIYSRYLINGNMATMHIDNYSFGHIVINNKTYSSDIIVYPDRVDPSWWRKEDLSTIITAKPDILIIGTGKFGVMKVPENTVAFLESQGIKVYIEKTDLAVKTFNGQPTDKIVIGAFHLTC
jgi:hypothetical protein